MAAAHINACRTFRLRATDRLNGHYAIDVAYQFHSIFTAPSGEKLE
jgi:hypothetical protein